MCLGRREISLTSTLRSTLASPTPRSASFYVLHGYGMLKADIIAPLPLIQTIHIFDSGNGVHIATRKPKASPHAVKGAYAKSTIRNRSGGRRSSGVVSGWAKRGYRPDLRKVCIVLCGDVLSSSSSSFVSFSCFLFRVAVFAYVGIEGLEQPHDHCRHTRTHWNGSLRGAI
jgi:hypothetical protein